MSIDPNWISAGSKVLGSALRDAPTTTISGGPFNAPQSNTGFIVATGNATARGTVTGSPTGLTATSPDTVPGSPLPWLALAAVALGAIVVMRLTKG